jgi:hypothetical protein
MIYAHNDDTHHLLINRAIKRLRLFPPILLQLFECKCKCHFVALPQIP